MAANSSGKWEGGYVRTDASGKRTFYIRRMIAGRRFDVSTGARTERGAFAQLARFEADPDGYSPRGDDDERDPIWLDKELSEAFLRYSKDVRQNSTGWLAEQKRQLAFWATQLHGTDLRKVSLRDHILPGVEKAATTTHAIVVIKRLFAWLRTVRHDLSAAEDPVMGGMLPVPTNKLAPKRRKPVAREQVALVLEHLTGHCRAALILQAATGWHISECARFARDGEIEPPTDQQKAMGVAGVLVVRHKSGAQHRTAVNATVLDVARALRERKGFSVRRYQSAVASACDAAEITRFGAGRMRHSVATWMVEAGADLGTVASFLGHRSPSTTKKFYTVFATPMNPLLALPAPVKASS